MVYFVNVLVKELLDNVEEFLASGEENFRKEGWNAAVSELFKTYTRSYNLRLNKENAVEVRGYMHELKEFASRED
jgi:hypothetical protein